MKNALSFRRLLSCGPLAALLAAAALSGCAESRDSLKKKVEDLQREVTRLNAEKSNAVAKSAALDDERLVLEKKVAACDERRRERSLKVVRLKPDEEGGLREETTEPWPAEEKVKARGKDKDGANRPVLTLVGARGAEPWTGPVAALPQAPAAVPPPAGYAGDNLGVVAAEGAPATMPDGTMEQFHEAYRAFTNARYDEALSGFSRFVAAQPANDYADNAVYWRGECLLAQGKLLQAVGEYERLLARYPRSEKAPAAMFRVGFVYDKLNDLEKASDYYFKVVDAYPGSDEARKASQRAAAIQESRGRAFGATPTSMKR